MANVYYTVSQIHVLYAMINIWEIHEQPLPMNPCIYLCIVVKRQLAQGLVHHQVFANKYWCVNVWCALIDLEDLMF